MVLTLLVGGAFVEQVCLTKWTATHEAAKVTQPEVVRSMSPSVDRTSVPSLHQVGCPDVLMQLLRHGAKVNSRDGHGVTPLAIAAEHGNTEALDVLIQHGQHQTTFGSSHKRPVSHLELFSPYPTRRGRECPGHQRRLRPV